MEATLKQLKDFVKEEEMTAKLYAKLGFREQARQEKEHADFFRSELRKWGVTKV